MTDIELAEFLNLDEREAAIHLPTLTPEKRELYERMAAIADALNRGERPPGVIVCGEHR